jgi:hypothetical protein
LSIISKHIRLLADAFASSTKVLRKLEVVAGHVVLHYEAVAHRKHYAAILLLERQHLPFLFNACGLPI